MKSIKKVTSKPYTEDEQEKEAVPVSPSKLNSNKPIDRRKCFRLKKKGFQGKQFWTIFFISTDAINAKKNRFGSARAPSVASEQQDTQPPAEEVTPQPTVKRPARSRFGFNRSN